MSLSNRFRLLPLLLLLATASAAWAQVEKKEFKLGLMLEDKSNQQYDSDVLNAATAAFVDSKRFIMVERKELNKIFTEKDLQEFIGGQANNKLSDVLGLDLLGVVAYTVETTEDSKGRPVKSWIIDVRLLDVRTTQIVTTISSNRPNVLTPLTPREAGERLLKSVREAFPPLGHIIDIKDKRVVINLGSEAGLKKGDSLEIVEQGEQIIDPSDGRIYAPPLEVVGKLSVVETSPQTSICKLKSAKDKERVVLSTLVRLQATDSRIVKWLLMVPRIKKELQEKSEALKDKD